MSVQDIPGFEFVQALAAVSSLVALALVLGSRSLSTGTKAAAVLVLATTFLVIVYWNNRDRIPPYWIIPIKFKITLNYTGIAHGSPTLDGSRYEEERCLDNLNDNLQFMGVHGSRWLEDDLEGKLRDTIQKAANNSGSIRFLIVHPDNEAYRDNKPGNDDYKGCYDTFAELAMKYPDTFEVKLYDKLPNFRITMDRQEAYVSRYFFDGEHSEVYDEQPMVELDREPKWNFVDSYLKYFELQWDDATPINECEVDAITIDPGIGG